MTGARRCRAISAQAGRRRGGRPVTKGWRHARFG